MARITLDRQKQINSIVQDLRLKTSFSNPEDSLTDLAAELGISVFENTFEDRPNVIAMLVYSSPENNDKPTIYIKKSLPETRKRFTLAHEIGHYLLHKTEGVKYRVEDFDYSGNSKNALEETEANYFAASLLIPEDKLKELQLVLGDNVDFIAKYFGVSKEVVETRIKWIKSNLL